MCWRCSTSIGLTEELIEIGRQVAAMMTEMFADLPPEHEFFEQFSFISAGDLPGFAAILERDRKRRRQGAAAGAAAEAPVAAVQADRGAASARRARRADAAAHPRGAPASSAATCRKNAKGQIEFFDPEHYNAAASLQDNILAGKVAYGEADAAVRVPEVLAEVLEALALRHAVVDVGLEYQVGTGGSRLSLAQRQRAAIARALLKRPDLLILNEATSALDGQTQGTVSEGVRQDMAGRGLIWVLHRASLARDFDRVLVMSGGKLAEQGRFAELDRKDSLTGLLIAAE